MSLRSELEPFKLTALELAITEFVTKGMSNLEIANEVGLEEKGIKLLLANIYSKLDVTSRASLIVKCLPMLGFNEQEVKEVKEVKLPKVLSKTETLYCLGDGLPYVSHLPCGEENVNKLYSYMTLDRLEYTIELVVSELRHSLNKYDRPYEPEHKQMCLEMRELLVYLENSTKSLALVRENNSCEYGNID